MWAVLLPHDREHHSFVEGRSRTAPTQDGAEPSLPGSNFRFPDSFEIEDSDLAAGRAPSKRSWHAGDCRDWRLLFVGAVRERPSAMVAVRKQFLPVTEAHPRISRLS